MEKRKYDPALIEKISAGKKHTDDDGFVLELKPIPDDSREHVLDPRILEIVKQKKLMFAVRAHGGFRLSNERYRPDKVSYDLTTHVIEVNERLIDVNGDHKIDVFLIRPANATGLLPVMVYLHGGGYTAGNMSLYLQQMKLVAEKAQALVVFPEYRLAPECPFPGPVEDAWATVRWVYENHQELGIDAKRLMVAGDSAGGGLTNACLLLDENHIIQKAFLIYPAVDSTDYRKQTRYHWSYDAYPIIEEQKEFAHSRIERIKGASKVSEKDSLYIQGKTTYDDPLVSVIYTEKAKLKAFPPVIMV
ncbi:MAG: alpha/beta hydrolase, partial [Erysipelotrichaceae bacterium]|nr:alpha/beta hydrolase [Erysipelotrichaceae bacterium]